MTFGEKLKRLREGADMTQDELAAKLYVSRTAVSKWETNRSYPSIDSLKAIQQLFGVSMDELIGDEDIQASLDARKLEARKLYWYAIACFIFAVVFCVISVAVYNAGFIAWVVPLRVIAVMGVVGYFAFALSSKQKYQVSPQTAATKKRMLIIHAVVLVVVLVVAAAFVFQNS
jgi:transcriptional regulator with XRE-family HTH domain